MRHLSLFFRVFPPPKFLTMPYGGLEISDDALRAIEYKIAPHGLTISKFSKLELPVGLVEGGEIKDEKQFTDLLSGFVHKNHMSYVKVSLPEEKLYLFQTDIPSTDVKSITQHVEFKLEENVPLSVPDAVFYFDILPLSVTGGALRATVSVAPKAYVEKIIGILRSMGLIPMAFEVAPKSIARAVVPEDSDETELVIHVMNKKTGVYIVSGGVVCFSSTIGWGSRMVNPIEAPKEISADLLIKEVSRVYSYWVTRSDAHSNIAHTIVVGRDASLVRDMLSVHEGANLPPVAMGDVWKNAFDVNTYIPPISHDDSLEYAVAAGLALPL